MIYLCREGECISGMDHSAKVSGNPDYSNVGECLTAVLRGKGAQSQEIARIARLYATYFYLDPLVL